MSFYKKYELIDVLRDDGVKTFQAKEIETGRAVEVHLFVGVPGKSDPPYAVLEAVRSIPQERRAQLVEVGEHMGTPYVVTLPLSGYPSLRDWVQANKVESPPALGTETLARVGRWKIPDSMRESGTDSGAQPITKRQSIPQPDTPDITRMFKTAEIVVPPREQPPTPWATGQMAAAAPPAPSQPAGQDDFELLFGSTVSPATPAPPISAAPQAASAQPSDFTQMFQTGGHLKVPEPVPPPMSPPPQAAAKPGEFTGLFGAPAASKPDEHDDFNRMFDTATGRIKPSDLPRTAQSKPVEPAKTGGAGEFTQMFQAPVFPTPPAPTAKVEPPKAVQSPPPADPKPAGPGEFTQMFRASTGQMKAPEFSKTAQGPAFTPPAEPPKPAKPAGPGEFTQMFQATTGSTKAPDFTKTAQGPAFTPPAEPAKQAGAPGEFTQMFHAPTSQAKAPEPSKTAQGPAFPPPPEPAKPAGGPGEFTQMFRAPAGQTPPAGTQAFGQTAGFPVASPAPAAPAPAAPTPPAGPGEFTQMFQTGPHQPFAESPTASRPITQKGTPPGVQPPPPQGPGEFTRMFASPSQPMGENPLHSAAPPAQQPPAAPREPGEFTRMFSQPGVSSLPKQQLPIATPQQSPLSQPNPFAPPTSPLSQPMLPPNPGSASPFGAPQPGQPQSPFGAAPPAPPPIGAIPQRPFSAPAQPSVQDEYAKLFGGGAAPGTPTGFSAPQAPAPPQQFQGGGFGGATQSFQAPKMSAPSQPAGPSEYTRMFNAPKEVQPAAPPPVQAPIPIAAAKKSQKWPIFVIGGIFLLLLIGLAVTLLRK